MPLQPVHLKLAFNKFYRRAVLFPSLIDCTLPAKSRLFVVDVGTVHRRAENKYGQGHAKVGRRCARAH